MARTKKADLLAADRELRSRIGKIIYEVVSEKGDEPYASEGDEWLFWHNPDDCSFLYTYLAEVLTEKVFEFVKEELKASNG